MKQNPILSPWGSISHVESTCFRGWCLCRVWGPRVPESPQEKLLSNESKKQTIMVEAAGISEFSLKLTPTHQILDFTKVSINSKRSYRIKIQESTWLYMILKSLKQPLAPPLHLAFAASFLFVVSVHPSVPSSLPFLSVLPLDPLISTACELSFIDIVETSATAVVSLLQSCSGEKCWCMPLMLTNPLHKNVNKLRMASVMCETVFSSFTFSSVYWSCLPGNSRNVTISKYNCCFLKKHFFSWLCSVRE